MGGVLFRLPQSLPTEHPLFHCVSQDAFGISGEISVQTSFKNEDVLGHIIEVNGPTVSNFGYSMMSSGIQVCPIVLLLLLVATRWLQSSTTIHKHYNTQEKKRAQFLWEL